MATLVAFTYDSVGRLASVARDGVPSAAYTYDDNGNRLSAVRPSGTELGVYDAQDRLISYGDETYTYAPNGTMRTRVSGNDTTWFEHDGLGHLTAVVLPDGTRLDYVLDGQNRRIGIKRNGVLQRGFLYQDQLKPVAELNASGAVVSRFVYGARANVPEYIVKGGVTYRIVSDHLGSVRLVVNTSTGAIAQRLDYDEYGMVLLNTSPAFQPFGFAGGILDDDTRLVQFGVREYDSHLGRWTANDPMRFSAGSTNLHTYVNNNPLGTIDPDGKCPPCVGAVIGGLLGGIQGYQQGGWAEAGKGAALGALTGLIPGFGFGKLLSAKPILQRLLTGSSAGAMANFVVQLVQCNSVDLDNVDFGDVAFAGIAGGASAVLAEQIALRAFLNSPNLSVNGANILEALLNGTIAPGLEAVPGLLAP